MLAAKLRPDITESEEHKMPCRFFSNCLRASALRKVFSQAEVFVSHRDGEV